MPRSSTRKKPLVDYSEDPAGQSKPAPQKAVPKKTEIKTEIKTAAVSSPVSKKRKAEQEPPAESTGITSNAIKKQKTKPKGKGGDDMPILPRTSVASLKAAMYIGAHVSAAGGVQNSVTNARQIGANSFALFLKSQRKWDNPPISSEAKLQFIDNCKGHDYDAAAHALPHGSYLVNLAQADETKAAQAYNSFVDDLERCEQLGIKLYNFHPGSTGGDSRDAAIGRIASQLNKAHAATSNVVTVLENMAGSGNVIGSSWEDLRDIIALVDAKDRVGVCIDTCHAFAAGYDLRTPEAFKETMASFDDTVGAQYLKALHLNDSKAPFESNRDLHANIGTGFLGLRAFHNVMNYEGFRNMPMVLETPIDKKGPDGKSVEDKQVWADEIKLLESLIGLDTETQWFKDLETKLFNQGASERSRVQEQVDKKSQKGAKKARPTVKESKKK